MKKLMVIGVMIVLMMLSSALLAREHIGGLYTSDGTPCEIYHVEAGRYEMVFPIYGWVIEALITLHGPRVVILLDGESVFSSDPPYDAWTMHDDTEDTVLDVTTFGHVVCGMIAKHFLKGKISTV